MDDFGKHYGGVLLERDFPSSMDADDQHSSQIRITEDTLRGSTGWAQLSRQVHELFEGQPFPGTDEQAANYGLATVGSFEYNLALGMIPKAAAVVNKATPAQAQAFATMLDIYDAKNITWEGAGRAVLEVLKDPTSYIGLGTLGVGFSARNAAKKGASAAFRQRLAEIIGRNPAKTMGVEAGAYTGAADVSRQTVDTEAGKQDGIDPAQAAASTALGVAAGAGMVKGADLVVKGAKKVLGKKAPASGDASTTSSDRVINYDENGKRK
jgi:hypothetical protein